MCNLSASLLHLVFICHVYKCCYLCYMFLWVMSELSLRQVGHIWNIGHLVDYWNHFCALYWNHVLCSFIEIIFFFFYWNHVFYWWECLFLVWLAYYESCPLIMPSVSHIWYITFGISLTYCSCHHVLCFILKSVMSSGWSKSVLQSATGTHFACPLVIILQCVAYTQ